MHFINKSHSGNNPSILRLQENKESSGLTLNFSLHREKGQQLAYGECIIMDQGNASPYLYISAINVEGHSNTPTKQHPNHYVGLGQILLFAAIRFGSQNNINQAQLIATTGSEGFYLKMGLHPKATGNANTMMDEGHIIQSSKGKLNQDWLNSFKDVSFRHTTYFTWPNWVGNISNLYPRLRNEISKNWEIVE